MSRLSICLTSSTGPIKDGTLGLCSDPVWGDHVVRVSVML